MVSAYARAPISVDNGSVDSVSIRGTEVLVSTTARASCGVVPLGTETVEQVTRRPV